ncbi:MAG: hypothetical protein ACOVRP_08950 [Gemmatimonas sp.]
MALTLLAFARPFDCNREAASALPASTAPATLASARWCSMRATSS